MKPEQKIKLILVSKEFETLRLDLFLSHAKIAPSRSQALKMISNNQVLLNDIPLKASHRVNSGEQIKIIQTLSNKEFLSPYDFPLDILFEDEEILIVNKASGLVVHPAPGHEEKTLVNILCHQKKLSPGSHPLRPGIVHRLDKDASGLLILAKSKTSQENLIQQFKDQTIKREYWALSLRPPSPLQAQIETWIKRHPVHRKKFISLKEFQAGSKKAITLYKLLQQSDSGISWIKCQLKTGRTHQIRVHMSSIACPLLGDKLYGGQKNLSLIKDSDIKNHIKNLNRIALHAQSLSFFHPLSKKQMNFESPWPENLKNLIRLLNFEK